MTVSIDCVSQLAAVLELNYSWDGSDFVVTQNGTEVKRCADHRQLWDFLLDCVEYYVNEAQGGVLRHYTTNKQNEKEA